ncbi:MAG: gamma-glutamyltransferase family protein [Acidobacteria bacterium]|nr:gamma-glutamyltransferase family protein [Acidobacteriota bacterium]
MRAARPILAAAFCASVLAVTVPAQQRGPDPEPPTRGAAPPSALRPLVAGPNGGVSTGHPLVTSAALEVLLKGGNAFDAGAASMLVGGVVEQDLYSLGGEGLVLVYPVREKKVTSINGQGWAPKAVDVDWYLSRGKTVEGAGLDPAVVPGTLHAALTVLEKWGTLSFETVAARAIEYARDGFPIRQSTVDTIRRQREFMRAWPGNERTWLKPDGSFYMAGDTIKLPDLARTLTRMVEAERAAKAKGRAAGIVAARDRFYKGDIAKAMVAFLQTHKAPFDLSDFAEYTARLEEPASTTYRGYTVYKHGFTSQGPVLLQTLNILEQFDLAAMKHDSADYVHTVTEAMKLAYADRDTYYADTAFVQVPGEGLLSKAYAKERAALINPRQASKAFIAGDPLPHDSKVKTWPFAKFNVADGTTSAGAPLAAAAALARERLSRGLDSAGVSKDTTHMAIIDKAGNVFDATPSGGWITGAVILGDTGIGMSVRGEQFWLDKTRAAQIRPRSRPRYTLTPSLVVKDGQPLMALGTPGGDNQDQTILQAFLNIVEFHDAWYPNLHSALEWPRFQTLHFHGSFWPHEAGFNKLNLEATIPDPVFNELKARGHDVSRMRAFGMSGCATTVMIDPATKSRLAGADPRRDCYAVAY